MPVRIGHPLFINGVEQESTPPSLAEFGLQFGFRFEPILKVGVVGTPARLPLSIGTPRDRFLRWSDATKRGLNRTGDTAASR
jgi:hypothetical protein